MITQEVHLAPSGIARLAKKERFMVGCLIPLFTEAKEIYSEY
jgi:hypothetical protein